MISIYITIYISTNSNAFIFLFVNSCVAYTPLYTNRQRYGNEDEIVPSTDNFMIFAILHFYNFILVIDTIV
jgi:hypothetical protein